MYRPPALASDATAATVTPGLRESTPKHGQSHDRRCLGRVCDGDYEPSGSDLRLTVRAWNRESRARRRGHPAAI